MYLLRKYSERYCAVVTDLNMPQPDGIAIARYIHETIPSLPVVIVSADDDCTERIRNAGLTQTVCMVMRKPADPFMLVGYVNAQCAQKTNHA